MSKMREIYTELDLSPSRVRSYLAGSRPYRSGGPRLEIEMLGEDRVLGHNYGHGGSGITMSWGSASEMVDLLAPHLSEGQPLAVLGAGVMGLCTASLLLDLGHPVRVCAGKLPPNTVSNVAGGLWAPTHVGIGCEPDAKERHERILRRAWQTFRELDGEHYGVEEIPLFETDDRSHPLDAVPQGLIAAPERLERLPFAGLQVSGQVSRTLLVETPKFLARLLESIRARGARVEQRVFADLSSALELEETVLVNCLGLGAGEFARDQSVTPIRGQLVLLDPADRSFVLDHAQGYVISRPDVLILGGTFEEGESDGAAQDKDCEEILERHRQLFAGLL